MQCWLFSVYNFIPTKDDKNIDVLRCVALAQKPKTAICKILSNTLIDWNQTPPSKGCFLIMLMIIYYLFSIGINVVEKLSKG